MSRYELHHGDSLDVLRGKADNSIDAAITDPPYGLGKEPDALAMLRDWLTTGHHDVGGSGFMGRKWDAFVPQPALWREVFRVLKPGGYLLAFAGTRTMDLMALGLRIAGFELRDSIGYAHDGEGAPLMAWVYGTGFPKSLDVSKAIDKAAGFERNTAEHKRADREGWRFETQDTPSLPPATDAARQWQGWGTALKPAWEPIIIARKPLIGTVAENVLQFGTGAMNIDGCRVPSGADHAEKCASVVGLDSNRNGNCYADWNGERTDSYNTAGRWPANLILSWPEDEYELAADTTDEQRAEVQRWLDENT